jgi:hypothetical protein
MYDVIPNVFIKLLKSSLYEHLICIIEYVIRLKLCIHDILTILSIAIEVVMNTQLRLIYKSADNSVSFVMGMMMPIRLTCTWLKCLASRTGPY